MTLERSYSPVDPELSFKGDWMNDGAGQVQIHQREIPNAVAQLAIELLHNHGVLLGTPCGEDSAGRAKLDIMPAHQVAERAFDVAEAVYGLARERGHMLLLPPQSEVTERAEIARDETEARKEARRVARQAAKAKVDA